MAKSKIGKPIKAVQLTLWLIPQANGKTRLNATIRHKCGDKITAVELIQEYVNKCAKKEKADA